MRPALMYLTIEKHKTQVPHVFAFGASFAVAFLHFGVKVKTENVEFSVAAAQNDVIES